MAIGAAGNGPKLPPVTSVIVTFETHAPADKLAEASAQFAQGLKDVPGLISKTWLADGGNTFGGSYLFKDKASADAYIKGPMFQQGVAQNPAMENVQVRTFSTIPELGAITGSPTKTLAEANRGANLMQSALSIGQSFGKNVGLFAVSAATFVGLGALAMNVPGVSAAVGAAFGNAR